MTAPSEATQQPHVDHPDWRVYCLCAAWCGVCGQWRADFERVAAAHPGHAFIWIDIEDEADVMGDTDVETFPTLLVARGDEALFFGPVPPQASGVARLLAGLRPNHGSGISAVASALLGRLKRRA
jgi:hypothetical protein